MDSSSDYLHPGRLFVAQYGQVTDGSSVIRYAEFLRRESSLSDEPPIDLTPIFRRFGISMPKRIPLPGQSGLLLNPDHGTIFISSDDPATRQRFSEAHELMELLFATQSPAPSWSSRGRSLFSDKAKERLCEEGAAELLMPLSTFVPYVNQWGVSLETGQRLAELYGVSLTAALLRAVRFGPGQHALVLWKLAWKPKEEKALPCSDQLLLFEDYTPQPPPQQLRVQWGCSTQGGLFIPPQKSVEFDTYIYQSYEQGSVTKGMDWVDLGTFFGHCFCESMAITLDTERHVLSVIHLPGDEHSVSGRQSVGI
jgi:hypothetical protein